MNPVNRTNQVNNRRIADFWLSTVIVIFSASVTAQESYSPYVGQHYPATVYWGDTHLHTSLSEDAYTLGNRIGPEEAYRFARGEAVTASNGMRAQLRKRLDFLVIADHAESIGMMAGLEARDPVLLGTDAGKRMLRRFEESTGNEPMDPKTIETVWMMTKESFWGLKRPNIDTAFTRSVWNQVTATADRHNDPGRFTAFIGYEWTSGVTGINLHRVVIFRDGAEVANRVMPFSAMDSQDPEALWAYLAEYEQQTGGEVLAIPHNGNLSNGEMFPLQNFAGQALTRSYAERRSRWEPLYEVTQIKGDSETHPVLSPTDEFADYETWNSWDGKALPAGRSWDDAERILKNGEYARSALKRGLGLQGELGVNPFKFGMIGSTDAHTSLSAAEENNFWGKAPVTNPGPDRPAADKLSIALPLSVARALARESNSPDTLQRAWQMAASGYAAVWATENTREALFAAMKRKETYATTGPRMTVRFFGGWNYLPEDALRPDLALIGYKKGIPMGGDLTNAPAGKAPRFLIRAVKDPDGAHLDRVQVIKGWRDVEGELHERIYNVALSDGRKGGQDSKAAPVGSTVDVKSATYANTIGAPELATVWTDPDFDPKELAFYYVRVLEIPTPRWTAYDAKFFGIKDIPPEVPMVTQERAYTSPIWYTPQPK